MALAFDERKSPFTYGEYLTWDDDERWELIDGIPYNMTPVPSTQHQRILTELSRQFSNFLRGRPEAYGEKDVIKPAIFDDLSIELDSVFSDTLPENSHTADEHRI